MNKKIKNIASIVLPTLTLVVGILIGIHYGDFKDQVIGFVTDRDDITVNELSIEEEVNAYLDNLDNTSSSPKFKLEKEDPQNNYSLPNKNEIDIRELWNVWEIIRNKFYAQSVVTPREVLYGAIAGMVDSLNDDHTVFLTPDQTKDFQIEVSGNLEGIGAEITYRQKNLVIVSVIKNSPAFEAGLKADDIILKIDGVDTSEYGFFEAIKHIRGEKGTEVVLTIIREDVGAFEMTIIRDTVHVNSVTWEAVDNYAFIQINRFSDEVWKEFRSVANEVIAFDPDGIIIDLRDNGGGYMDQAVEIVDAFVSDGVIVSRKYKDGEKDVFYASDNAILDGYPLAVLVNSESASASEIFAGAIQDYGLGVLIGQKTYGKGSVQQTFDFNGATLKMTIAKWFTPKDRNIDGIGLDVDIEVEYDEDQIDVISDVEEEENTKEDLELDRAIQYFETGK